MTKESDEYELLVRELHEALVKNDGVENICVLHNVKIKGKSGATHQIDVYWEFKIAGVTYKTCIECKCFKSSVKKSHIAAFAAILEDIGNATGIFATSFGYQSGAKLFAQEKGIRLVLVNYLIKTINIQGKFLIPRTTITNLEFDKEHVKEILKPKGLDGYEYSLRVSGEDPIYDESGLEIDQIGNILKDIGGKVGDGKVELENSFYPTEIGNVRLLSIEYNVSHSEIDHEQEITVNDTSNAILEDFLENTSCYLNDDGTITEIET
ncbi:restriction endonuclease [Microbulbifer taiwanensis]|uniref:Restriction endonuclease n=1 Tax=Microbulbifer taiwanensis TaxID=986746 RepID=A0ABW1YGJ1_9GAMM|nr:restriction endonuclease [Microbulbifer taiwanensis]